MCPPKSRKKSHKKKNTRQAAVKTVFPNDTYNMRVGDARKSAMIDEIVCSGKMSPLNITLRKSLQEHRCWRLAQVSVTTLSLVTYVN